MFWFHNRRADAEFYSLGWKSSPWFFTCNSLYPINKPIMAMMVNAGSRLKVLLVCKVSFSWSAEYLGHEDEEKRVLSKPWKVQVNKTRFPGKWKAICFVEGHHFETQPFADWKLEGQRMLWTVQTVCKSVSNMREKVSNDFVFIQSSTLVGRAAYLLTCMVVIESIHTLVQMPTLFCNVIFFLS